MDTVKFSGSPDFEYARYIVQTFRASGETWRAIYELKHIELVEEDK